MRKPLAVAGCIALLAGCAAGPSPAPGDATDVPPCGAAQLALGLDAPEGPFDGMSHSGAFLVVRNAGDVACSIAAVPELRFLDASGADTRIARGSGAPDVPDDVTIPPGGEVSSALRWISGDVGGPCVEPATLRLVTSDGSLDMPFGRRACAPEGGDVTIVQPPLAAGPRAAP